MISEWKFTFEARDFHFAKVHRYRGEIGEPVLVDGRPVERLEFSARIEPSDVPAPDGIEQLGDLTVAIPLPPEQSRDLAYSVAEGIAERISFASGDFRLRYGLVTCRRIGETDDEVAAIGDKPLSAEISLIEVLPVPAFESAKLTGAPTDANRQALMSQFNAAKREHSPAARFLGFARILESVFSLPNDSRKLVLRFQHSDRLRIIYSELIEGGNFESAMDNIVYCRDRCAHLKLKDGFGFAPLDPELAAVLIPHLPLAEEMARRAVYE